MILSGVRARCASMPSLVLVSLGVLFGITPSEVVRAQTGEADAWLEYSLRRDVLNGDGVYEGWSDRLEAEGHYDFQGERDLHRDGGTPERAERGSVHARYRWRYRSPDDRRSGSEDRTVAFDPTTRAYLEPRIDLDDYDELPMPGPIRTVWWRIDPAVADGATVQILDEPFVVRGRVPASPVTRGRETIELSRTGDGERHDAYGDLTTEITDRYWFDAETGWFLREVRTEHATGSLNGERASFDVEETVSVTDASFVPGSEPRYDHAPPPSSSATPPFRPTATDAERTRSPDDRRLMVVGAALMVVFGIVLLALRRRRHDFGGTVASISRGDALPADAGALTQHFGPLLPHLVEHTVASGMTAVIAKRSGSATALGLGAPPGEAATIFGTDTAAVEAVRRKLGTMQFFSELRHEHGFDVLAAANQHGTTLPGKHAYNVLETHEVLALSPVPDGSYDTTVVRRAKPADLPAIVKLADAVYQTSCGPWIGAAQQVGDVILVAEDQGAIVGFAMVSVGGSVARFHGLTVAPSHQRKGLGKELNRARVKVAHDLGAERAIVEVAAWNVASLEIARAMGFTKVGQMFVESASAAPQGSKFRRR